MASRASEPQKDLPAIEETDEPKGKRCADDGVRKWGIVSEEYAYVATDKTSGELVEIYDVGDDVNGDGVHAHPDKRLGPFLEFPDINHLQKHCQ